MQVTYLIAMELPDGMSPEEITGAGLDIEDELITSGFEVISVTPWARPSLGIEPQEEDLGLF